MELFADRRTLALIGGLLIGLSACAAADKLPPPASTEVNSPTPMAPASPAVAADFEISLRRGPCFGRCPQYSVRIDAAGRVSFAGERNVAALGEAQGQVAPDTLSALIAHLRQPELAALRDIYRPGQPGCGATATDMPSSDIEWRLDGRFHRIRLYQGCSGEPETLRKLPAAIDAAAGTAGWIQQGVDR